MCELLLALACTWTPVQQDIGTVLALATVIDYAQTRNLINQQKTRGYLYETNRVLGASPSKYKVTGYFILMPVLTYIALDYVPNEYRTKVLTVLTAIELKTVANNVQLGIKLNF